MEIVHGVPPKYNLEYCREHEISCAIDIEVGNIPEGKLHHPVGDFAIMTMTLDGETVYYVDDKDDIEEALSNVIHTRWVMANGMFDIRHLRRWAFIPARPSEKLYWDVIFVERIMWANFFSSFSLQSIVRRYLRKYMGKEVRSQFKKWDGVLTPQQINYACMDAVNTYKAFLVQRKIATESRPEVLRYWDKIECPTMWTYLDIKPIPFNKDGWNAFADAGQAELERIIAKYPETLLSSSQQVQALLLKEGFAVTNAQGKTIESLLEKNPANELLQDLMVFKSHHKNVTSYGRNWSEDAVFIDGEWYILTSYDINKAVTGRPQASDPAIMTVPVRKTPKYREFFEAKPDHVLVVGDYSQQEPRIAAFFSGDKALIEIFRAGGDVYTSMGKLMLGNDTEITSKIRSRLKDTVLAVIYGQSVKALAKNWGVSYDEAKNFIKKFHTSFPELFRWTEKQNKLNGYVTSIMGRRFYLNPHSHQSFQHKRNAPIQSSAADMKKYAISKMWMEWNEPFAFPFVIDMHDEFVFHVLEKYGKRMEELMVKYMVGCAEELCPTVPFVVDGKIVSNWLEAK